MDTGYDIRFSIIIPAYNSAATISSCLQSVLRQTFPVFEILVIDGLSDDDTVEIIQSFKNPSIKVTSEKDNGIYDAMNKGIWQAKGNWLYFLGSDDELHDENVLKDIVDVINSLPNVQVVFGDVVTTEGKRERYINYNFWDLVIERCICHQAIFYHRAVFNVDFYDTRYKVCADWDFNLKIFAWGVFSQYIPRVIAKFNTSGVSGQWQQHPEYLANFADRKKLVVKYKSSLYLPYYYINKLFRKIKRKLF
ncbi:glycosyltransferase [Mucilaginibacter limnophilus]|uniref:Glycosyltransferase n=1 Tax=Mucilaginibacter limnophilus TaxID=1932778 RepID=A0A3S2XZ13_9SPHI|nr:glycosyltransferase family 2 protein [Mucilaginibacter limnophilus]RVT98354.1 glycosyltransferase [Mucilaginibacter limnophilus]